MEVKITKKKENPLLNRIECEADLSYQGKTIGYAETAKEIAAHLKTDEKLVVIKHIYPKFGMQGAKVLFYAYKNESDLKRIEPKPKEKKAKVPKAEAKAGEKNKSE